MMRTVLFGMGVEAASEVSTNIGIIDLVFSTNTRIWIIEVKMANNPNGTVAGALEQIETRGYAEQFAIGKTIIKLGIVISKEERNIIDYGVYSLEY